MQILKTGSTGAEVALLQLSLRRAQYGAPAPDGVFGGATKSALQAFQRTHGLTPDGIFGAETERALAPWLRGYAVHTVRPGDTLFSLAERYDASLGAIETANPALDPFALRPGQRITVPLPFSVVPTDIPWCSTLMDCAVDGLTHRYPQLRAESIGRSALSRPIWALTAGDGLRRVLYSAAHHANEWITTPLLMKYLETLLRAAAAGETVFGYPAEDILFRAALTFVPLVDPDGVDLVTGALPEGEAKERAAAIAAEFPAIPYPDGWKANIAGISLMGGGLAHGNWTPAAEFNILADPEAADVVFRSGLPITMAGLDVTEQALLYPEDFARIRAVGNPVAETVAGWLDFFFAFHRTKGYAGAPVHDAVAVCALLRPDLLRFEDWHVTVETQGAFCRGATAGDRRTAPNARVITGIDREGFAELLTEAVRTYG